MSAPPSLDPRIHLSSCTRGHLLWSDRGRRWRERPSKPFPRGLGGGRFGSVESLSISAPRTRLHTGGRMRAPRGSRRLQAPFLDPQTPSRESAPAGTSAEVDRSSPAKRCSRSGMNVGNGTIRHVSIPHRSAVLGLAAVPTYQSAYSH